MTRLEDSQLVKLLHHLSFLLVLLSIAKMKRIARRIHQRGPRATGLEVQ